MYYFRVISDQGDWLFKRGASVVERCASAEIAIALAEADASSHRPSQVLLHGDGESVSVLATFLDDARSHATSTW